MQPLIQQLWTEAAQLLGQPGTDAASPGSPAPPSADKPKAGQQ